MSASLEAFKPRDGRLVGVRVARTRPGTHRWGAFIVLHVVSALVMIAVMATVPEPSGKVALVYWPTATATEAFRNAAAAGGRAIRFGNVPWIVIAAPEPDDHNFFARARATGALLIINPLIVGGCFTDSPKAGVANPRRS